MGIVRSRRSEGFTIMGNRHLQDRDLSLKAKGLLSVMLSLPEGWNYNVRGLASICREGKDAVAAALRELEAAGYVSRRTVRGRGGRIRDTEYAILESPQAALPRPEKPDAETPAPADPPQIKKEPKKNQRARNHPFPSGTAAPEAAGGGAEFRRTRAWLLENLELEALIRRHPERQEELEELAELVVETVCARRRTTRVAGADFPHEAVRSRFCKLTGAHLEFVLDGLLENAAAVRCTKQYLLAALFNAPATMSNAYAARVNRDLAEGG